MAYLPIGVSPSDKKPSIIVNTIFAQGTGSSANQTRDVLLIGCPTSSGSISADGYGVHLLNSSSDVISKFGARSQVHRMFRQLMRENANVRVYGYATIEPSAGQKATGTLTLSGTSATATGVLTANICGETVSVGININDTPTILAAALTSQINSIDYLGCTASASTGTITISSVLKGIEGNEFTIRIKAPAGCGITAVSSGAKLTGGSGNPTMSFSDLTKGQYYYYVQANNDLTSIQALTAHIDLMASPQNQTEQVGIISTADTLTNAITISTNGQVNHPRIQLNQLTNSEIPSCELSALIAGVRSKMEANDFGSNLNGARISCPSPYSRSDWASANQIRQGLENGVSVLNVDKFGNVSICSSRSTYSKNPKDLTQNDYRCSKTYVVSVADAFTNDVRSSLNTKFLGKKVSDNTSEIRENVVQPKHLRAEIHKWIKEYVDKGQLDPAKLDEMLLSVKAVYSTGTLSSQCNIFACEDLDHVYVLANESSNPQ